MSRKSNRITIHLHVGETFVKDLRRTMEDEMEIAARKWYVDITGSKHQKIIEESFVQLFQKIYEVTKNKWEGEDVIEIRASNASPMVKDFHLPRDTETYHYLRLVRMRDGWTFTNEDSDGSVFVRDFAQVFTDLIHEWARTAVFYGVASYT